MSCIDARNSCERRDIWIVAEPVPSVLAIRITMTLTASKLKAMETSISIRPKPRCVFRPCECPGDPDMEAVAAQDNRLVSKPGMLRSRRLCGRYRNCKWSPGPSG